MPCHPKRGQAGGYRLPSGCSTVVWAVASGWVASWETQVDEPEGLKYGSPGQRPGLGVALTQHLSSGGSSGIKGLGELFR